MPGPQNVCPSSVAQKFKYKATKFSPFSYLAYNVGGVAGGKDCGLMVNSSAGLIYSEMATCIKQILHLSEKGNWIKIFLPYKNISVF